MKVSPKTTGIIAAALAGAATGTVIALAAAPKRNVMHQKSSFTRTTGNLLDTAGTIMLNMSDLLK
jgi:hypothetical protein